MSLKTVIRVIVGVAVVFCAVVAVGLGYLIYPGQPGSSRYLKFEDYILLPKHGLFNGEDYLTLRDKTLWVAGMLSGSVFRVSLDSDTPSANRVAEWREEPRVHGIALAPPHNLAFVTRSELNVVDAFSPSQLVPVARIPVADDPDAILYDAARDLIYAVSGDAGVGTLIDPGTKKIVGTIPLGAKAESAAIDPASGLLYQNLESANSLAIIDLDKRRIVDRQPLGPCKGPSGIAIDAELRRAFIVCGGNAMLVVFDLVDHHIVTSMAIGSKPDVVDFDPVLKRIYATGLAGTLSIVQQKSADTYELLDEISTHFGAHTLAVDPATHKVYIAYAGLMVAPRVAVFSSVKD